jgi:hypothetical protein
MAFPIYVSTPSEKYDSLGMMKFPIYVSTPSDKI